MKEFLLSNYDIEVDNIYVENGNYYFFVNNTKIYVIYLDNEKLLDELFKITNELYLRNIMVNTFIINNKGFLCTERDNKKVALLKVNNIEDAIDINDILLFNNIGCNLPNYNILDEWKYEVDSIEKEIIEYNKEYQLLQKSINYFLGLAENAIQLLSNYKKNVESSCDSIGHLFKDYSNNVNIYYPFSFIKVNKMYDVANYIKREFFDGILSYEKLDYYFEGLAKTSFDKVYLFSCLMYPNMFFNCVKGILYQINNEGKIKKYIDNIKRYEELLRYCKVYLRGVNCVKSLMWLNSN